MPVCLGRGGNAASRVSTIDRRRRLQPAHRLRHEMAEKKLSDCADEALSAPPHPRNKRAKLTLQLLGVFTGAFLVPLLVVPLLGPGWHLLHGDFISYGGWRIPVPKGFSVKSSQEGPNIWKMTLGIPIFDAPYGHISIYGLTGSSSVRQPFDYDRDYSRFEGAVTQEAHQSGYLFESKRTTPVGKNSGYCLEFTRSVDLKHPVLGQSRLMCAVESSTAVLYYEGDPRYISDVFTVLQGMSLEVSNGH